MNRRKFIENILKTGLIASVPRSIIKLDSTYDSPSYSAKLTILHTNDTHARIDPFPSNSKYAGMGGIARRAQMVKKERKLDPDLLLLDSGDIFQGTPYFNYFGGELDLKLMSVIGYDATTIGNHEFDNGLDGFAEVAPKAQFPFLCANYGVRNTPLAPFVQSYKIIHRKGFKIGVFGLGIELQGLVTPNMYGDVKYRDPIMLAKAMVRSLKYYESCDLVVCLSHLGYNYQSDKVSDVKLAQQVKGIDVILGGHTHTFLDEPFIHRHDDGSLCCVHQVGFGGIRLGKIELLFNQDGKATALANSSVDVR